MSSKAGWMSYLSIFASLVLVGCGSGNNAGGSNGSGTSNSTPGQAQGVYEGTTSVGQTFNGIILPNDTFYAIYGNTIGNVFYVCGIATGQGVSNNGKYTATENDFYYCGGSYNVYSGSVSGTYTPGTSISGTITENGNSETFTGTAPAISLFNYNAAASISAITGSWNGSLTDGETASVNIDSLGNFTGISSLGCSFSGSVASDTSGKNFFDVSLTFGGPPCVLSNRTGTGIGVDYLLSDAVTTQLIAGVSSGSSLGIVFAAER